jgi:hypothetical protein
MATTTQRTDLRLDLGLADDETTFTNTEVDRLFTRAAAKYPGNTTARDAYVRVLACNQLRNKYVTAVDYEQNDSAEKLSQIFKNLEVMRKTFEADLADAVRRGLSPLRVMKPKRKPRMYKEYPDA